MRLRACTTSCAKVILLDEMVCIANRVFRHVSDLEDPAPQLGQGEQIDHLDSTSNLGM